jgi:hypothetical protein
MLAVFLPDLTLQVAAQIAYDSIIVEQCVVNVEQENHTIRRHLYSPP